MTGDPPPIAIFCTCRAAQNPIQRPSGDQNGARAPVVPGKSIGAVQSKCAIAEEFDIPVGIHVGFGPPNAAYESSPTPVKTPDYRVAHSNPLLLEDLLVRHKKLRLYAMHAAWPLVEPMIAMLYAHPGLYVDVGGLHNQSLVPRASYYRHLRGLVEAGFGKRIMFGSDFQGQANAARAIDAIRAADFLTAEQKADILCGNAQRFLRLPEATCR